MARLFTVFRHTWYEPAPGTAFQENSDSLGSGVVAWPVGAAGTVLTTMFFVARPSVPVAGSVSTAALPDESRMLPPANASAAVEA